VSSGEIGPAAAKPGRASLWPPPAAVERAGEVGREELLTRAEEPCLASGEWGGEPPPIRVSGEVGRAANGDSGRMSLCSERGDLVPWLEESKISSS
jgi:hypothetical protein